MQKTVANRIDLAGPGLHSGVDVCLSVHPAPANAGIYFIRTDVHDGDARIPALWSHVTTSELCTLLSNDDGVSVSTVEHLMAAFAGCGILNARVEVDGPELPILDGSAQLFVEAILAAGIENQDAPALAIEILKPVEVTRGAAFARLEPAETLSIDFSIEYDEPAIGNQRKALTMANGAFVHELSNSRTFCCLSDVEAMYARGLAKGGTVRNAVVVDRGEVLTPGGLRHSDEAVRHKMLDAMGDLMLAGGVILGRYTGKRAGHAMTNKLLHALFDDPSAWRYVDCTPMQAENLPGAGVTTEDLPQV